MKQKLKSNETNAFLFLLPAFIIYVLVIMIPTMYSFVLSLFKWNVIGEKTFIGLDNYKHLFTSDPISLRR